MSSSSQAPSQNGTRRRAGSIQQAVQNIESNRAHHLTGPFLPSQNSSTSDFSGDSPVARGKPTKRRNGPGSSRKDASAGLWNDVITMKWMRRPSSSFKLLVIPWILYFNWQLFASNVWNPFKYLLAVQYRINEGDGEGLYAKGYGDIAFILYYVIVFSFIRQSLVIYVFEPIAKMLGVRKASKIERFTEQGYAIAYFSCTGTVGLITMYNSEFWYFKTTPYWTEYPHWKMTGLMKWYYLCQFSYWLQQLLVMALRLEKPRKDFAELVAHHLVTLWLIGWSYLVNFTPLGNAVFITMDWSDVFFALAKAIHYTGNQTFATCAFIWFIGVWSYGRHYLNIKLLWSVLTEFKLVPKHATQWKPEAGVYCAPWLQWQIFGPMFLLQLVNLFWYYLILRIAIRSLLGTQKLEDSRSDDEDDGMPEIDDGKDD